MISAGFASFIFCSRFPTNSAWPSRLEFQMLLEERQHLSNYATLCAPVGIRVPKPVVLLGFVRNAKLIQLMRERLVRVDVVPDCIVARPVKLETAQRLQ